MASSASDNTPQSPRRSAEISVNLLISSENYGFYAQSVGDLLSKKYGIPDVSVRSANIPVDRLSEGAVSSDKNNNSNKEGKGVSSPCASPPMIYVILGPATPTTSALEMDSPVPVVSFPQIQAVAATTGVGGTGAAAAGATAKCAEATALQVAKICSLSCDALRRTVRQVVTAQRRQAVLVQDVQWRTSFSLQYRNRISDCYDGGAQITGDRVLDLVGDPSIQRKRGKVRDVYSVSAPAGNDAQTPKKILALVTTDRQSGFDRQLAMVPFKGAVLNLTSAYWFERTASIVPNHIVSVPHPYVSIVKQCEPFPIEFVVRSYMTGSTSTSIWKNYQGGAREYCGHTLPEGMRKNQKLPYNMLTPTTKEEDHDALISAEDIVKEGWMTKGDWDRCADAAMKVFELGQRTASDHGLILVDTKYEFGRDSETGEIRIIDEVHTPDSSRYWLASTYEQRMIEGKEPDNIDKEFLRLWFRENCDPYGDGDIPDAPKELVRELSRRYISLYEMITWREFDFDAVSGGDRNDGEEAIAKAIRSGLL